MPFELLAKSLPQQILAKHKNNPKQIEALVFGQAGFLDEQREDWFQTELYQEYNFLKKKYSLVSLDKSLWKFLRLRPNNFPTIRLAQFSALVLKSNHLFSKVLDIDNIKDLSALFSDLPVNKYWETHYQFCRSAEKNSVKIGRESIVNILINTVSVCIFVYGRFMGIEQFEKRALSFLESLPSETNQIIRRFVEIGIKTGGADKSQSLLQLKKNYCDQKRCLNCSIGVKLLNQD